MKTRLVVLAVLAMSAFYVFRVPEFSSVPHPAKNFQEAMAKFSALQKEEATLPLRAEGRSRVFTHSRKTERVFVLLHGLTNCPEQFVPLARILFDSGANVVLPRARYAGYADRLNDLQGLQSAQDLLDQAATGLDIAAGLGDRVSVVGLSGSSVAAAWMAENRTGIESVLLLSPFFSLYGHPVWMIDFLSAILSKLPNFYQWWDNKLQDKLPGPPYAYPRYGTRCMADTIQLSRNVRAHMYDHPLPAGRMDILITGTDIGANNSLSKKMEEDWNEKYPGSVTIFEFPEKDGVPHDMVDVHQPGQKTAITYPKILQLLGVPPSSRP
ncbi:MAG: alpha/beta hydrolase [Terrimicrobiaceae bacterium]